MQQLTHLSHNTVLTRITFWVLSCGPDDHLYCSTLLLSYHPPVMDLYYLFCFMDIMTTTVNFFLRWTVNTMLPIHGDAGESCSQPCIVKIKTCILRRG